MKYLASFLLCVFVLFISPRARAQCSLPTITGSCAGLPCATSDANGQGVTVTWTTNVAADSAVGWGWTASGNGNVGTLGAVQDSGGVTSHSYHVTGLLPGRANYGLGIRSRAISSGLCPVADWAFFAGGDNQSFLVTTSNAPAGSFDYSLTFGTLSAGALGGNAQNVVHVTQGFGTFLNVIAGPLVSSYINNGLKYVLSGLPPNVSLYWADPNFGYGDTVSTTTVANDTLVPLDWHSAGLGDKGVHILTNQGGTTPAGSYVITLTASANNGSGFPTHTSTVTLVVDSSTSPFGIATSTFGSKPSSYPAIPNLSIYLSQAQIYGAFNCAQDSLTPKVMRSTGFLTKSITAVGSAGSHTVTLVGDVSQYSFNIGQSIVINFPGPGNDTPSDTETITTGNWSISGQVLTATFAQTHISGFSVQISNFLQISQESGSWYYDGVVAYQNVANILDVSLNVYQLCVDNVNSIYRDNYVISSGQTSDFRKFSRGPYIDYGKNATPAILTLFNDFDLHKITAFGEGGTMASVNALQRETAYDFESEYLANKLGVSNTFLTQPTSFYVGYYLDQVLLHVDEICLSQSTDYFEFFMVGLQARNLIHYYEDGNHDARIPSAIKCLADYLYPAFDTTFNSFPYDAWHWAGNGAVGQVNGFTGSSSNQEVINNLISPMYAWLFKMTGQSVYQTEGDNIWSQGVTFSNEGGAFQVIGGGNSSNPGKIFSQNYNWGTDYILWREQPGAAVNGAAIVNGNAGVF